MWDLGKTQCVAMGIFGAVTLQHGIARADTVFDTTGGAGVGSAYSGNSLQTQNCAVFPWGADWASRITLTSSAATRLDAIDIPLAIEIREGETNGAVIKLQADANGSPGAVLEAITLTPSVPGGQVYRATSAQRPVLQPSGTYWVSVLPLVHTLPGTVDGFTGVASWFEEPSGAARPLSHLSNVGGTWATQTPRNMAVRLVATPISPVPALPGRWSFAFVAALGAGAFVSLRNRGRR